MVKMMLRMLCDDLAPGSKQADALLQMGATASSLLDHGGARERGRLKLSKAACSLVVLRMGGDVMNVAAILRQKGRAVTTANPSMTLLDVAGKLAARRIGAVVVVGTRGEVVGIISERDIIRALGEEGLAALKRPVGEIMTRLVVTCQETDTLDELMAMMTARRFRHLPVVTDNALVGIISIGDVVKHHVAEVEMEATAMREYITHS
jgi:CBS domain-containing protein